MAGFLLHSPADCISKLLEGLGIASDPTGSAAWPAFVDTEPDSPDNCITVSNTQGNDLGRVQITGERMETHGIQIRIRATTTQIGYAKARAIAVAMDQSVYEETIHLDSSTYLIQSVSRSSDILPLGKETPTSNNKIYTVNFLVFVRQVS